MNGLNAVNEFPYGDSKVYNMVKDIGNDCLLLVRTQHPSTRLCYECQAFDISHISRSVVGNTLYKIRDQSKSKERVIDIE